MNVRSAVGSAIVVAAALAGAVLITPEQAYACLYFPNPDPTFEEIARPWIIYAGGIVIGLAGLAVAMRDHAVSSYVAIVFVCTIFAGFFFTTFDACATPSENIIHAIWIGPTLAAFVQFARSATARLRPVLRKFDIGAPDA